MPSSNVVRIYSLSGEFLGEWPIATRKGQWSTNLEHLPDNYKGFPQWNGPYFIQKAQLIGKNTETVIRTVLKSRLYEVQTYRMCLGILNFTKKYSNKALEECCMCHASNYSSLLQQIYRKINSASPS